MGEHNARVETTRVEWDVSGTNTSTALVSTNWTATPLVLPFDSDLSVVTKLR